VGIVNADNGLATLCSALEKIILNGYSALGLMYFFTVGEDEVKAWTIQVIHLSV